MERPQEARLDPWAAKAVPRHEPRDGMVMCAIYHRLFARFRLFLPSIYSKQIHKFVFINYSDDEYLQEFHGKVIVSPTRNP